MLKSRLWIDKNGENFIGSGKIKLLEKIKELGSINAAAKAMNMSYKTAWDRIERINTIANSPIVLKVGNGSKLSDKGEELVKKFRELENMQNAFLSHFDDSLEVKDASIISLSARNQIKCVVRAMRGDNVRARLELYINENITIYSDITKASLDRLNIGIGSHMFAVIKANFIGVSLQKLKADNVIKCKIASIEKGENTSEITLEASNLKMIATLANNEAAGFEPAQKVYAYFDAQNVILGR